VHDFACACECGLKCRTDNVQAHFAELITRATEGRPFFVQAGNSGEPLHFSTDGEHAFVSWIAVPVLEAARLCLSRQKPDWQVRVFHPTKGDPAQCSLVVHSGTGRSELRVNKDKQSGALICQVTHGVVTLESSALEMNRGDGGRFVAVGTFETLVGEFLYEIVKASMGPLI
jgi:hypothetical protein